MKTVDSFKVLRYNNRIPFFIITFIEFRRLSGCCIKKSCGQVCVYDEKWENLSRCREKRSKDNKLLLKFIEEKIKAEVA